MTVALTNGDWAVAVLLAAGSGLRSGLDYPKQFLRIGGVTVLEHSIGVFEQVADVDEIVVVTSAEWLEETREIVMTSGAKKVTAVIPGGVTRNESTQAAIRHLRDERGLFDCKLLVHDAVRPLLAPSIVKDCVEALDSYAAVDVVIETADTIVEVEGGRLVGIPNRSKLRRGQTPQAFRLDVLSAAYEAISRGQLSTFTDDCAVVLAACPGVQVGTVAGSEENIKITHPIDVFLADRLLQARQAPAPGAHADVAELRGPVVVIGGSSGIGQAIVQLVEAGGGCAQALSPSANGVDVRDASAVAEALASVRSEQGPIGAVVNAAGILTRGNVVEMAEEDLVAEIEVNLLGCFRVARLAHGYLKETEGHLVMFTSSSYTRGRAGYAVYSATKAGVVNLTQALADEWMPDRIKVNCINPARTLTPMRVKAFGDEPSSTLLDPDAVARATVGVLGGTMTGHVFDVRLGS